ERHVFDDLAAVVDLHQRAALEPIALRIRPHQRPLGPERSRSRPCAGCSGVAGPLAVADSPLSPAELGWITTRTRPPGLAGVAFLPSPRSTVKKSVAPW